MAAKKVLDLGSSKVDEKKIETIDIFKLDGVTYSAPKDMPFGVALEYMEAQVEHGPDAAVFLMIKRVLGEDAFRALKTNRNLTQEQFQEIIQSLEGLVLADESGK